MKKENDEITDLFRTLSLMRDDCSGWLLEELSQDIPVACQHSPSVDIFPCGSGSICVAGIGCILSYFLVSFSERRDGGGVYQKSWWRTAEEWMEMVYVPISCRRQWNLYCRNRHLNHSDYYRSILRRETRFPFPFSHVFLFFGNYHHGKWQPIRQPRSQRLLAGE